MKVIRIMLTALTVECVKHSNTREPIQQKQMGEREHVQLMHFCWHIVTLTHKIENGLVKMLLLGYDFSMGVKN